jgi:hypothetical protein
MTAGALLGDDFDCLRWFSPRRRQGSAWHGHVSFAHWLVWATRPSQIVELGTHNGVSYAAFCNAVTRLGLKTKCYAVDSWEGDVHAGFYSNETYEDIKRFNELHFSSFSSLLKMYFDQALDRFKDGSIDILHIDGLHTYEAVKKDFEDWLPKLSDRAVVLFHDTQVFEQDFGVHKLWDELKRDYPGFEFQHSYGLGVLGVGRHQAQPLKDLYIAEEQGETYKISERVAAFSDDAKKAPAKFPDPPLPLGVNIARYCRAEQSSHHEGSAPTPRGALSGEKTGGYGFHTQMESEPWWKVDLGGARHVTGVIVYNRLDPDCIARSAGLLISYSLDGETWYKLHDNAGKVFGGLDAAGPLIVLCEVQARYIRVSLPSVEYLHLDEVEVYSVV